MKHLMIVLTVAILAALIAPSMAIDSVAITSPADGQKFKLGDEISARVTYSDLDGNGNASPTFYVNGEPSPSRFTPTERGFYVLEVIVEDSMDGSVASDSVTIQVRG